MRRILIWRRPIPGSEIDIFGRTDYHHFYEKTLEVYGYTSGVNYGNKVWYQGICSEIEGPENCITFRTNESAEEINDRFDLIVYPMANFFSERFCRDTTNLVKAFSQIRIPVYILACGAQARSYDHLDDLVAAIADPAKRFIDSIYKTGGEFALRGFFTKEFFRLLGYSDAVVTGCPSLYQLGPDLRIEKQGTVPRRPVINGKIKQLEQILHNMPDSVFMDQDLFMDCLYNPKYFEHHSLKRDILFTRNHSVYQAELLGEGRIHLIPDVSEWYQYLRTGGFDYSYGTKIHGSIMPILSGIPATVLAIDSRTREMAEFFDIPTIPFKEKHRYSTDDLLAAYQEADYSNFNANFKEKFDTFERFLIEKGIVDSINKNNHFLHPENNEPLFSTRFQPNREAFQKYADKLRKERPLLELGNWVLNLKNKE